MLLSNVQKLVNILKIWQCQAVTITGGGEPLMHPQICEIFEVWAAANIEMGLVTNAFLFPHCIKLESVLSLLTWCRISISDDRPGLRPGGDLVRAIDYAVNLAPFIDWAFSYVVTRQFDLEKFLFSIWYAVEHRFTHMRAVSDLLDLDAVPDMDSIRNEVRRAGVDDSIVIYQGRKEYERGDRHCRISLIKPVISADGRVFPCCGAQYAMEPPTLNMPDELCMGTIDDLPRIFSEQAYFNGSACHRCYYKEYNRLLDGLIQTPHHVNFV